MRHAETTQRRRPSTLPLQMLAGLALGLCVGLLFPEFGQKLQWVGTVFIRAVQMIVIPVVFSAVTLGICRMGGDIRKLGRVALVSFGWFYGATLISILVALGLNGLFHPGVGAGLVASGTIPPNLALSVDWIAYLTDLIPANVLAVMAGQKVLPTLVFASIFGLALATMGDKGRPVVGLLEAVMEAMFRMTGWIVSTAPLAIFAIMAWLFASQGLHTILALGKLVAVMYLALAVIVGVFMLIMVAIGEKPLAVARQMLAPVVLAFSTRSSEVVLPLHYEKLEAMGVPNRVVSIVLPLGYSFNLDGSALYIGLTTTFLAEAYHIPLTLSSLTTILVTALIASKGVANIPSGGLIALATVLTSIGLPVEAIAIVAGVDAFMDMGRTAVNVFGNTAAVLLIRKIGGFSAEAMDRRAVVPALAE